MTTSSVLDPVASSASARSPATVRARTCPVCDSAHAEALFDNRMAPIADIDFSYGVLDCVDCGMVYASQTPDEATLARYYRESSKYDHPTEATQFSACDLDRAEVAADFTGRLLDPSAQVLDIGCATGLYLAALARRGFAVRGLDPSAQSAEAADALFGIDVDVGDAQDYARYDAFDGIALLAVLEHLRDPGRLLRTLATRMKRGATLIVEVPSADAFGSHPAIGRASEPFGEFSNEHINFFGHASLCRLAQDAGLTFIAGEPFHYTIGIDGLLAAFRKEDGAARRVASPASRASVVQYVAASRSALVDVEARIARTIASHEIVLYGAGSHSARLLAQGCLADADIRVVLDRNPHLTGRTIGGHRIARPEALRACEGLPVVVSTFNAMKPVVDDLRRRFPNAVVPLYL